MTTTALEPQTNLVNRWGQAAAETRRKLQSLEATFRELHLVTGQLRAHDVRVSVDLGPIGNAAYSRYQTLQDERDQTTFSMPAV